MHEVLKKSKLFYVLFTLIAVLIACILLFKPVMRMFYPLKYAGYIEKYSNHYDLDKYLVMGMISAESGFDPDALSHKNAKGIMQVQERTAKWCIEKFSIKENGADLFDPELNINIGCSYMNYLTDKFGGNINTALAAYNAGEGNVSAWLSEKESGTELNDIPFKETENYVKKVNKRINIYRFIYS